MKKFFTLLTLVISLSAFAQKSNLIIFNNGGQQFFVILNGIKQNAIPKTNVKIEGLAPAAYKVKIIFADGRTGDIDKNIYLDPNMEYSAQVVIKNAKKRSLKLYDMAAINTSPYGAGSETISYRPDDGAAYSDQNTQGTSNTSGNTQGTAWQNGTGGQAAGTAATSSNGQAGGTVTTGATGMNGNVSVNASATGLPAGYTQTTVTNPDGSQTVTTTYNGQTTQVTTSANGQTTSTSGQVSGSANTGTPDMSGNISMGMPAGYSQTTVTNPDGSQTVTTTYNGQTTQVTTSVNGVTTQTTTTGGQQVSSGSSVNGTTGPANVSGTHTHADGTVHDHNHNVIGHTTAGTHTHADGTVHDHNHNPVAGSAGVNNDKKPKPSGGQGAAIVNPDGTLTCNSAVSEVDILVKGIKSESFSSDQMQLVKTTLNNKCINSDQAYRIVNAFTFDGDKIAMAKFCYDHMTDRKNASKLLDLFSYSSSKEELTKYFSK